jgi:hypothetical protein
MPIEVLLSCVYPSTSSRPRGRPCGSRRPAGRPWAGCRARGNGC